jgi:hypothetical protein
VTDSQEKGDRFAEKGDRLTGKGDRLTDLSTITVTIPSPKPSLLTDADSENSVKIGFEDFGVGVESVLPDTTDPAKGRPSPPSPALRQFYIKGVGLTEGTSYQDAESRVREKREQYLIKKGGGQ